MTQRGASIARIALGGFLALVLGRSAGAAIVINEIMYNSLESPDIEYVEIVNTGPAAQSLTGWYLLDADPLHTKCYLSGTLAVGAYLVIAGDLARFQIKYPGVTNLNPNQFEPGFSLGNSSDTVRIFDNIGALRDAVAYDALPPWPTAANGTGPSLELINPTLDNVLASSWAASTNPAPHGTPGSQNSVYAEDRPPIIDSVFRDIPLPISAQTVTVTAHATDDGGVPLVALWVDKGSGYVSQPMFDDGAHGDGQVGDQVFGARITPASDGTLVKYYIAATDSVPQTTVYPQNAPASAYIAYTVGYRPPYLVINEALASNLTGITDEFGQYEDWAEIRNRGTTAVNLDGMFLSFDVAQPQVWRFPSVVLGPGAYLYVWCDNDVSQGPLHTSFKLTAARGDVALFDSVDHGNVLIHGFGYALLAPDVSFGYRPDDADAPEYIATPTPGASNDGATPFGSVVINEFLTTSAAGGLDDWVELYNRGAAPVDIGGWHLTDERDQPTKYTFPPGTVIPSGGFFSVGEATLGFAFSSTGSEIILLDRADGATGEDYFDYGPQSMDVSQGRLANGTPYWHFFGAPSRDLSNSCGGSPLLPGTVSNLRFDGTKRVLSWDALPGAQAYDVVQGSVETLISSGGNFSVAVTACPENGDLRAESWQPEIPAIGAAKFYVVRGVTLSCGFGSYDSPGSSQVGSRDAEIAAASASCP